jgi:hypothetical protein
VVGTDAAVPGAVPGLSVHDEDFTLFANVTSGGETVRPACS